MKKEYNIWWINKRKPFVKADGKRNTINTHDERNQQFYTSSDWIVIRNLYRNNNPLCCMCKEEGIIKPLDIVDHIISITDDYDRRFDYDNLQSLCYHHHLIKTNEDIKARREKKKKEIIKHVMDDLNDFE